MSLSRTSLAHFTSNGHSIHYIVDLAKLIVNHKVNHFSILTFTMFQSNVIRFSSQIVKLPVNS